MRILEDSALDLKTRPAGPWRGVDLAGLAEPRPAARPTSEEGCPVRAYESFRDAAPALQTNSEPSLLIAELSGDEPPSELEQLTALVARLPVWVLASRSKVGPATLEGRGFESTLFRPVDMGDLVNRVKRRLGELTH